MTRNVGMHAGGVLIAPGKLTDFCPLYTQRGQNDSGVVSQYDKDDVEAIGLVKFDFLGLTTLTILDWAERLHPRALDPKQEDFALRASMPLNDRGVVPADERSQDGRGVPAGIAGMQRMLKDAKPTASRTSSPWWRCTARARWT